MRCPQCGYHSYAGLRRCKKCGALLSALELPSVTKPLSASEKAARAAAIANYSAVPQAQLSQDTVKNLTFTNVQTPKKAKPFPDFLLERDRQPSFFDQVSDVDNLSSDDEVTEGQPEVCGTQHLLLRRSVATLIDLVVLAEIWYAFILIGAWSFDQSSAEFLSQIATQVAWRIGYYFIIILTMLSYFTLFHSSCGQTFGKFLLRLKVVTVDASPVTNTQALLRSVGGILALLCAGFGYVMALFDERQRGWNDRLAGTMVVAVDNRGAQIIVGPTPEEESCEIR
ncbi:MAG: RDD family protein [Desulfuromonas sp.]|nr:RDD family protein [Desulfuromonas sp.]